MTIGYIMHANADGGGTGGASRCVRTGDGIWWVDTREIADADHKIWKYDGSIPTNPGDIGGFDKGALKAVGDVEFSDKSSHRGNIFYDPVNKKLHSFYIKNNAGSPESEYNRHSYNGPTTIDWDKDFVEESPSVVSGSAYTGRHHGITADSNGVAWIPHYDFTANKIAVEYRTLTGSWIGGTDIRTTGDGAEPGTGESALAVFPWNNAGVPSIGVIFVWGGEYGFAHRADSAALSAAWTYETLWAAASAPTLDNHLHGIAYDSGSETTSRICVCMKSGDGSDIYATRRDAAGDWATPTEVGATATAHTECTIAVDKTNDEMRVFFTTATNQFSLFYDKSPTGTMSWGGTDTVAIEDAAPTASKGFCGVPTHAVDSTMGLMVIVSFDGTNQGWNLLDIAGGDILLVLADSDHLHVADNLDLVQANVLALDNSDHLHFGDNLVLDVSATLIVQDSDHLHTGDNLDLVQANVLVMAEAFHDHIADNLDLVQANVLAVDGADHLHDADNLVLDVVVLLIVAQAFHLHIADNLDLVQANVLAVDDSDHLHFGDNLVLDVSVILATQDADHLHAGDNLDLVQANVLAVDDSDHLHAGDNVDLIQAAIIEIDNAFHDHTAEAIVLDLGFVLVVAAAAHDHTAENLDLVQAAILAIDNAFHDHFGGNVNLASALTIIVSNAVHQVVSDNLNLADPSATLPDGIVFTIDGKDRVFVISTKDSVFVVLPNNRV